MRASRQEGGAGWSVQAAGRPRTVEAEGRARAERTENMFCMSVTLDVSKLSGWLNADARCRVQSGSIGGGATCGQKQAGGWGGVVGGRKRQEGFGLWRLTTGHARGAHPKHIRHACDAGRVPARYVGVELA